MGDININKCKQTSQRSQVNREKSLNLRALLSKLDEKAVKLFFAVYSYHVNGDLCYATQTTLGKRIGAHRTTVSKLSRIVEALGLLDIEDRAENYTYIYHIPTALNTPEAIKAINWFKKYAIAFTLAFLTPSIHASDHNTTQYKGSITRTRDFTPEQSVVVEQFVKIGRQQVMHEEACRSWQKHEMPSNGPAAELWHEDWVPEGECNFASFEKHCAAFALKEVALPKKENEPNKKGSRMFAFTETELKVLKDTYSEGVMEIANKKMTKMVHEGKSISAPFNLFVSLCEQAVEDTQKKKTPQRGSSQGDKTMTGRKVNEAPSTTDHIHAARMEAYRRGINYVGMTYNTITHCLRGYFPPDYKEATAPLPEPKPMKRFVEEDPREQLDHYLTWMQTDGAQKIEEHAFSRQIAGMAVQGITEAVVKLHGREALDEIMKKHGLSFDEEQVKPHDEAAKKEIDWNDLVPNARLRQTFDAVLINENIEIRGASEIVISEANASVVYEMEEVNEPVSDNSGPFTQLSFSSSPDLDYYPDDNRSSAFGIEGDFEEVYD